MFTKTIDTLTIAVMVVALIILVLESAPIYSATLSIFNANIYGF
jgi:hypothetical protein